MAVEHRPTWPEDPALRRWQDALTGHVGLSPAEAAVRLEALLRFCRDHGCAPRELVAACGDGPGRLEQRTRYLALAGATSAHLIVQSFLIHNGINIFGEIVCMPTTPSQVRAEQGAGWPASGATPMGHDDD